jgi:hypothetical protein
MTKYRVDLICSLGTIKSIACDHAEQVNTLISYASTDKTYTEANVWTLTAEHSWPQVDIVVDCVEGAILELNELPRGC